MNANQIREFSRASNSALMVILVESKRRVREAIAWGSKADVEVKYIALTPATSYEFEREGISCSTRDAYYPRIKVYEEGIRHFHTIEKVCSALDAAILQKTGHSLPSTRFAFFQLKLLYDVIVTDFLLLNEIIVHENPMEIRYYGEEDAEGGFSGYEPFSKNESPYRILLASSIWPIPATIVPYSMDNPLTTGSCDSLVGCREALVPRFSERIRAAIAGNNTVFSLAMIAKKRGIYAMVRSLLKITRKRAGMRVALYGSGYNWDDSLPELYEAGIVQIHRIIDTCPDHGIEPAFERLFGQLMCIYKENPDITSSAVVNGVDLSSAIAERVARVVTASAVASARASDTFRQLVRDEDISCLLLSIRPSPIGNAVVHTAHELGIPVISWQHGGAGYTDHPLMLYIELLGSDIHFVFGEAVAKNYCDMCERYRFVPHPTIVPIGSASLDADRCRLEATGQVRKMGTIVYFTTAYFLNTGYISYMRGEFDEELWKFQKEIIDIFSFFPQHNFIIKLHPSHHSREPLQSYIGDHNAPVQLIVNEQSAQDLFAAADLIIFDLVSTGILQACLTQKPILVYTGLYHVDAQVTDSLAKRAHVSSNKTEFFDMVRALLLGSPLTTDEPDVTNREFVSHYGTYSGDGRSATRAAALVIKTIRESRTSICGDEPALP